MATRWRDLSDKEKGFFGGDKSTFQTALGRAADAGADLNRARSIEDYIVKPKPKPSLLLLLLLLLLLHHSKKP